MFGMLPSYGFFVRHAGNIRFSNVRLQTVNEELRPALFLSDVTEADFSLLRLDSNRNGLCNVWSENCRDISFGNCRIGKGAACFVKLNGNENKQIAIFNNILSKNGIVCHTGRTDKREIHESGNIRN